MNMDRKIEKSRKPLIIKTGLMTVAVIALSVSCEGVLTDASLATVRVDQARVTTRPVSQGAFEDFIPVRGSVMPLKSVFLDAIEGGRVEQTFVEAGSIVKEGQPLLELSNTSLQLDV